MDLGSSCLFLSPQTPLSLCHPLPLGPGQAAHHSVGSRILLQPYWGPGKTPGSGEEKRCSRYKLDSFSACELNILGVGYRAQMSSQRGRAASSGPGRTVDVLARVGGAVCVCCGQDHGFHSLTGLASSPSLYLAVVWLQARTLTTA